MNTSSRKFVHTPLVARSMMDLKMYESADKEEDEDYDNLQEYVTYLHSFRSLQVEEPKAKKAKSKKSKSKKKSKKLQDDGETIPEEAKKKKKKKAKKDDLNASTHHTSSSTKKKKKTKKEELNSSTHHASSSTKKKKKTKKEELNSSTHHASSSTRKKKKTKKDKTAKTTTDEIDPASEYTTSLHEDSNDLEQVDEVEPSVDQNNANKGDEGCDVVEEQKRDVSFSQKQLFHDSVSSLEDHGFSDGSDQDSDIESGDDEEEEESKPIRLAFRNLKFLRSVEPEMKSTRSMRSIDIEPIRKSKKKIQYVPPAC